MVQYIVTPTSFSLSVFLCSKMPRLLPPWQFVYDLNVAETKVTTEQNAEQARRKIEQEQKVAEAQAEALEEVKSLRARLDRKDDQNEAMWGYVLRYTSAQSEFSAKQTQWIGERLDHRASLASIESDIKYAQGRVGILKRDVNHAERDVALRKALKSDAQATMIAPSDSALAKAKDELQAAMLALDGAMAQRRLLEAQACPAPSLPSVPIPQLLLQAASSSARPNEALDDDDDALDDQEEAPSEEGSLPDEALDEGWNEKASAFSKGSDEAPMDGSGMAGDKQACSASGKPLKSLSPIQAAAALEEERVFLRGLEGNDTSGLGSSIPLPADPSAHIEGDFVMGDAQVSRKLSFAPRHTHTEERFDLTFLAFLAALLFLAFSCSPFHDLVTIPTQRNRAGPCKTDDGRNVLGTTRRSQPPFMLICLLWMSSLPGAAAYSDPLRGLTLNCNGLWGELTKSLAILRMISNCFPHILILTETWRGAKQILGLPADPLRQFSLQRFYNVHSKSSPTSGSRGVAILVLKSIPIVTRITVAPAPIWAGRIAALDIRLADALGRSQTLRIIGIYAPTASTRARHLDIKGFWDRVLELTAGDRPFILGGDLNAYLHVWECSDPGKYREIVAREFRAAYRQFLLQSSSNDAWEQ